MELWLSLFVAEGVGLDYFKCPFQLKQQYDSRISGPLDRALIKFCAIGLPDPTQHPCIPIHQPHPSQGGTDFIFLHTSDAQLHFFLVIKDEWLLLKAFPDPF